MKKLLILLAFIIGSQNVFADCSYYYRDNLNLKKSLSKTAENVSDAVGPGFGLLSMGTGVAGVVTMGAVGTVGFIAPAAAVMTVVLTVRGVKSLTDIKENKMLKLIRQSENYVKVRTNPGKQLKKLHTKLSKTTGISMLDLANTIYERNLDGSLCQDSLDSFNQIKRKIREGDIALVEVE